MRLYTLLLVSAFTSTALAQEEPPPAPPTGAAPEEGKPQAVRVTTFLLAHPGIDDQLLVPVMKGLDDGLKRNTRLEMKDLDTRLAEFAQEVPQDQIEQGRADLTEGQKALTSLDLPLAIKKLTAAVDTLSKVLPFIKKQELADAMMALGAAQFEHGDKKASRAAFLRLLTWRPDFKVDMNKYPPSLLDPFESARREIERAKRGSLDIRSEPPAAQAYVDGKYIGVTPTFAEGLVVGEHFITLKREGYRKAVQPAQVSSKEQRIVKMNLERSGKFLLVEQALKALDKVVGGDKLDDNADNLKEVLFIDHAVFVRAKAGSAGMVDLEMFLYDVRTKKRLARVQKEVAVGTEGQGAIDEMPAKLYEKINYDAEMQAPADAPLPQRKERAPFWKTWWFWTAAGVFVVGVVVVGVAVAETRPPECGNGNFCPGFTF